MCFMEVCWGYKKKLIIRVHIDAIITHQLSQECIPVGVIFQFPPHFLLCMFAE